MQNKNAAKVVVIFTKGLFKVYYSWYDRFYFYLEYFEMFRTTNCNVLFKLSISRKNDFKQLNFRLNGQSLKEIVFKFYVILYNFFAFL